MSSGIIEASPQRGGFQARYRSGPLGLVYKVHDVFISRGLPFTSQGKQGQKPIANNVFWTSLTYNSKDDLCLELRVLLDGLWVLRKALSTQVGKCYLNNICVSIYILTYNACNIFKYINYIKYLNILHVILGQELKQART